MPSVWVRLDERLRANALGTYPRWPSRPRRTGSGKGGAVTERSRSKAECRQPRAPALNGNAEAVASGRRSRREWFTRAASSDASDIQAGRVAACLRGTWVKGRQQYFG